MVLRRCSRIGRVFVMAMICATIGGVAGEAAAGGRYRSGLRGEAARNARQSYDYYNRNSNRNVFRRSRHFHPTRNAFRSSRHYQQRLAASNDGYPLRSFSRYTKTVNGRRFNVQYDYAHHRRQPYGPSFQSDMYGGRFRPGCGGSGGFPFIRHSGLVPISSYWPDAYYEDDFYGTLPWEDDEYDRQTRPRKPRPRQRWEIEHVPVHLEKTEPTERAVMHTERLADGGVRTVISSTPINGDLDDAWNVLADGNHSEAISLFAAHALNADRGVEATLGHGIALLLDGDRPSGMVSIQRALTLDADLLEKVHIDRRVVKALGESAKAADGTADQPDDATESVDLDSLVKRLSSGDGGIARNGQVDPASER